MTAHILEGPPIIHLPVFRVVAYTITTLLWVSDCDEMLTGKADSISCDGPGCDQRVRVISLGWIHL
jgi:hypothetical protein